MTLRFVNQDPFDRIHSSRRCREDRHTEPSSGQGMMPPAAYRSAVTG
jgi:hypothetical protein